MVVSSLQSKMVRRVAAWSVAALVALSATSAFAIDKSQIMNLQLAGLSADVIVNVIRSDTSGVNITEAEIGELRAAGIPQPVLDELCLRVGCTAAPGGGGTAVRPGGGRGGNNAAVMQQERERQQRLEEDRRRIEQERFEQERANMVERIEADKRRTASVQTAFAGLRATDRLMREGEYLRAAAVFERFMTEVNPAPESPEYYAGLTGFVRAMHKAGYAYAIRGKALEWVLLGPGHTEFAEGFAILDAISRDTNYFDPSFERLADLAVSDQSPGFQDAWNFCLGRFFWTYENPVRAIEFFSRISDGSPDAAKGAYLSGTMQLKNQENRDAIGSFQRAITLAGDKAGAKDAKELSYLALARLAYEVGQYDAALFYYRKVGADSQRHPRAMFEQAWTYFLKQDWNRTLGALQALHSPYYSKHYFPELGVIEAAAFYNTCNLEAAERALAEFDATIVGLEQKVAAFVTETVSPEVYWDAAEQFYALQGTGEAVKLPVEAIRTVLRDKQYQGQLEVINQLRKESKMLEKAEPMLGSFATETQQQIELDIKSKIVDGGLRVAQLLREMDAELVDWRLKGQEVGIEINGDLINATRRALEGGTVDKATAKSELVLAQDWLFWPYEGEYWADEVDYFRGNPADLRDEDTGLCAESNP